MHFRPSKWISTLAAVLLSFACSSNGGQSAPTGGSVAVPGGGGAPAGSQGGAVSTVTGGSPGAGAPLGGLPGADGGAFAGGSIANGGSPLAGNTNSGGNTNAGGSTNAGGNANAGGSTNAGGAPVEVDPSLPLAPMAFFPSKDRTNACADAAVSIQFNRPPVIQGGGKIEIHEATDGVFDSVTAKPSDGLYFSDLVSRSTGGETFKSEVLDVAFNTVFFHPKGNLDYGKTYYVTVDEGVITDSAGTKFSVTKSDNWTFTVRDQKPAAAGTLAADGSGDYCSLEGLLQALPDSAGSTRVIQVKAGVYPGIVRMSHSKLHFKGAGIDQSVFAHKNSSKMNSDREGFEITGSNVTFENLTIFNTYLKDSSGQQAEALSVEGSSKQVFLNNVHLRSHQDTLRVNGALYMKGGKISGSTDPLWGTGVFYCDGCELSSRTPGHAFVVARSTKGFAMVNCSVTKESDSVTGTSLAQYHDGREAGKIAFVNCKIDDHIDGWRRPDGNDWYEYNNTNLKTGEPIKFNGKQLSAGSPELDAASSPQRWLGWAP